MTSSSTDFPLVTLHPVADARHAWVALLLQSDAPADIGALARCFGELGLLQALDGLPCIVDLAEPGTAPAELADLLPAAQMVLRFPVAACAAVRNGDALARLKALGFRLMADGLPADVNTLSVVVSSLASACPGAKSPAGAAEILAQRPGPHLAWAVETPECHASCRSAGFHWFVGSYAIHPAGSPAHGTTHQALLMRLLALVAADADSHEIEAIFKQDVHLSYQLLKLVNSVAFSLSTRITSFNQAITLLGRRQLQRWLQLLLYARAPGAEANPLLPQAAWRAELMGALCARQGADPEVQDRAFMVGMFSLLGVLLGMTTRRIIEPLNLAEDVTQALTEGSGPLGALLHVVEAAEQGSAAQLAARLAAAAIEPRGWMAAQAQAYRWAIQVSREA